MHKQPCSAMETEIHVANFQSTPHPGVRRAAGVLRQMRRVDADAVAAEGKTRSCARNMVRMRVLRMPRTEAKVCCQGDLTHDSTSADKYTTPATMREKGAFRPVSGRN